MSYFTRAIHVPQTTLPYDTYLLENLFPHSHSLGNATNSKRLKTFNGNFIGTDVKHFLGT